MLNRKMPTVDFDDDLIHEPFLRELTEEIEEFLIGHNPYTFSP
jgi:hypothetical protein